MTRPIRIAPSILAAEFARLGEELEAISEAGAEMLHVDIMDGHFVPNISFGADIVAAMKRRSALYFDVHLMIAPVDPFIKAFAKAGADRLTVHAESGPHVHRTLQAIRAEGIAAGVAINPGTPVSAVEPFLDLVDLVLVMSVNPGFGGQAFIPSSLDRLRAARALIGGRAIALEVDGGVSAENAGEIVRAGADTLVAGSSVFKGGTAEAYRERIGAIRAAGTTVHA